MNFLKPEIAGYMRGQAARHDEPVLVEMEKFADERGFPIVGRLCGLTLEVLARAIGARRVFELGSGFGYSAYWFARAVGPSGEIHLTDGDPANRDRAEMYLSRAGVWDRMRYHVGDALSELARVEGEFDVVYNDVDKVGYPDVWRAARERVRVGGLYVCDNVLWYSRVVEPDPDEATRAILEHNAAVAADDAFLSVIVPQRDGLMVALRLRQP